jgi:diaminopimelate epimerase
LFSWRQRYIHFRSQHPRFEQGGFLEPSVNSTVVRLQMAGGEFCGNAALSVGAWAAQQFLNEKNFPKLVDYTRFTTQGSCLWFAIEVSGAKMPLLVQCKQCSDNKLWVEVEMPIIGEHRCTSHGFSFAGRMISLQKVCLDGITHILFDKRDFPEGYECSLEFLRQIERTFDLQDVPAIGLIWFDKQCDCEQACSFASSPACQFAIEPFVYVRGTDTLMAETACGSGSLALATAMASRKQEKACFSILQPSESTIDCSLVIDPNADCIKAAHISSIVEMRGEVGLSGPLQFVSSPLPDGVST